MWRCVSIEIVWIFIEENAKRKNSNRKTGKSRSKKKIKKKLPAIKQKYYLKQVAKVES